MIAAPTIWPLTAVVPAHRIDRAARWRRRRRLAVGSTIALALLMGDTAQAQRQIHRSSSPSQPSASERGTLELQDAEESRDDGDRDDEGWDDEGWDDEDWDDDDWDADESGRRSFLFKELVLSVFYAPDGMAGVPPGDMSADTFDLSPRPPGSYVGFDYISTFGDSARINQTFFPKSLPLTAIDLHPRILYDQMEACGDTLDRLKFAPQDFWLKLNPGRRDRFAVRIGQFVIPYGVNPVLAPRQISILPIEATDLGLKWDWGVDLKGPAGEHDWEMAATIGSGEALHSPHLFEGSDRSSYLFTGRIGAPTYWDFQYGASFLYGDLPMIRGAKVFGDVSISRWRLALDAFYKHGTYLMFGGQLTYGQDGFADDEEFVMITGGATADVLGYRVWADYVLPANNDYRLRGQFESVIRDVSTSGSDDTAAILELSYSLTTAVTFLITGRVEVNSSMGNKNDALYFTFVYYGR